jgi:hypothetical protein
MYNKEKVQIKNPTNMIYIKNYKLFHKNEYEII